MLIETRAKTRPGNVREACLPGVLGTECSNESPSGEGIGSKRKPGSRSQVSSPPRKAFISALGRSEICGWLPSEETSEFENDLCIQEKSLIQSIGSVIQD